MRMLHTADWHLNDRLHGQDRTEHLRRRVERVAELCKREAVDALLIAGDMFSEQATRSRRTCPRLGATRKNDVPDSG